MMRIQKTFEPIHAGQDGLLLQNPDRGFRTETVWYVKDAARSEDPQALLESKLDSYMLSCLPERIKMNMIYIYLTGYRGMDIPPEGLDTIRLFFAICRWRRFKIMARFGYCDDWQHLENGADEATILRHIDQLAPLIHENADVIHIIQSGFVGAYGEWASVYQVPAVDYRRVITAIVEKLAAPNDLYFQIRLPEYKNLVQDLPHIYNRIGYNIDAFFGEQQLYGWESGDFQKGHPNGQWEQLEREAHLAPNDGELFVNVNLVQTRRMVDGYEAILQLYHHRHTALSCWHGYKEISSDWEHETVMGRWKTQPITEEYLRGQGIPFAPGWFSSPHGGKAKRNCFQFVRDYLGYKLEIESARIDTDAGDIRIRMDLRNYGFAAAYNLESGFALLDGQGNVISSVRAGDPAAWRSRPAGAQSVRTPPHRLEGALPLPENGRGRIAFYLKNTMGDYARAGNQMEVCGGFHILHDMESK